VSRVPSLRKITIRMGLIKKKPKTALKSFFRLTRPYARLEGSSLNTEEFKHGLNAVGGLLGFENFIGDFQNGNPVAVLTWCSQNGNRLRI